MAEMDTQLKQTLTSTAGVGAVLGLLPAPVLIAFAFLDAGPDDHGPAFVFRFAPWFLLLVPAVLAASITFCTLVFGLLPWTIHRFLARLTAGRRHDSNP